MKYLLTLQRDRLGTFVVAILITIVLGCLVYAENHSSNLDPIDDFKAGDRVDVSVTGLEGDRYYEPCVIMEVRANGYSVICGGREFFVQKAWARAPKAHQQPNRPAQNTETPKYEAPVKLQDNETIERLFKQYDGNESGWLSGRELQACRCIQFDKDGDNEVTKAEFIAGMGGTEKDDRRKDDDDDAVPETKDAQEPATDGECASNAPPINRSGTQKPSETLFKGLLFYNYNLTANGTGIAPLKVGVTFLTLQIVTSFTNTVTNVPYVGAVRKNDAAPVNATIYNIKSKHIVCEQYRDGVKRRQVEGNYACFKNRDGEWICGIDGFPKIVQLN